MYKHFFKRLFDLVISSLALILIGWLILIIAVLLHFANKGAGVFFLQERPGKDEKLFRIIKFKTMSDERDQDGHLLPDRQRLTKVGRIIRSLSIDELPQILNVFKGEMSFIGPRPLLTRYLPYYTERERLRHSVRPGISGWAQIHGRNLLSWDEKLEYDAYYAEHVSFLLDLKIFVATIVKVFKRDGVVPDKVEHYLDIERQFRK